MEMFNNQLPAGLKWIEFTLNLDTGSREKEQKNAMNDYLSSGFLIKLERKLYFCKLPVY
jgi:hypothetical protein